MCARMIPYWKENAQIEFNCICFVANIVLMFTVSLYPCNIQFKSEQSRYSACAHAYQFPLFCCFKRYQKVTFENKLGLKSYILNVDIEKEFSVEFSLSAFPGRLMQLVYILVYFRHKM